MTPDPRAKPWRGMREPANQKELSCRATVFFKRACHSERSEETPINLEQLHLSQLAVEKMLKKLSDV